jgi:hypothetical protein
MSDINTETAYTLNSVQVHFPNAPVTVGVLPYDSHETLRELRAQHNTTHVFRRYNSDKIISVAVTKNAPQIGETFETWHLWDAFFLSADLIRNALLCRFHEWGRPSTHYSPLRFFGPPSQDLLRSCLPPDLECPQWLGVRPQYEMEVRVMHFDDRQARVYLTLSARSRNIVELNCLQLLERDFFLEGSYVGHYVARHDPRLAPKFETLGRVDSIEGNTLLLCDARDATEIDAASVFVDARREAFNEVLRNVFKARAPQVRRALDVQLAEIQSGPGRLKQLQEVIGRFKRYSMIPGVSFCLGKLLEQEAKEFPPVLTAPRTTLIFHPQRRHTDKWNERGIQQYGPYTAGTFTPARPRACVVCRARDKGRIDSYLSKLLHGVQLQGDRQPFEKGMIRLYNLENLDIEFFTTQGDSAREYLKAARDAVEQGGQRSWDLAFVQTDDAYRPRANADNPYLVTKAFFLGHSIPSQEFRTQTAEGSDYEAAFSCNNIALASYAKMGGVPWLIQADASSGFEFVIGLGSASVGQGRFGPRERVVGITTVFRGDGLYELSNISRAVPIEEYGDTLLTSLHDTIERVRDDNNWRPRQYVRLIFHSFKPLRDAEAEAVQNLMKTLGNYDVDYAFLHLAEGHPHLLFNRRQQNVKGLGGQWKGAYAPTRGHFLRLSERDVLLALKGPREVKTAGHGVPKPMLLKLHRSSTFTDTSYLARQVFHFSNHSWQTFFPSSRPVTITYSQMIARLLGQFATLPNWNPDALYGRIGNKRWFL